MKRIPVNLASDPIERRLWIRRVSRTAAAIVAAITVVHLLAAWSLVDTSEAPETDFEVVEILRQWTGEASYLAANADPRRGRDVAVAVGLGNALIDQRVFPWGSLFALLEESMPDDVRLEIIQPVITLDGVRISLTAASRSADQLLRFLAALEERPEFVAVYPGRQLMGADGDLRLSIEALARMGRGAEDGQ